MSDPSTAATPPEPEAGPRQRASYANPGMRISDAERAEVADRLSQHFSDGRLEESEFGRRLDQAMHAVTQADLNGLFDDLPGDDPAGGAQQAKPGSQGPGLPGDRSRGRAAGPVRAGSGGSGGICAGGRPTLSRVIAAAVFIVIAVAIGHAVTHLFVPWVFLLAVLVFWLLHRDRGRRSRGHRIG
jgi:hypothetical protein